jgi:hypothetical protein
MLVAVVLAALAPLWHSHEADETCSNERHCPVCVAAHQPASGGEPAVSVVVQRKAPAVVVELIRASDASQHVERDHAARGPPAA